MAPLDLQGPVRSPPPGVTSNFSSPDNEAALAYGAVIASILLVTFFTWFRICVKAWMVGSLHSEDYILPFAWLTAIVHFAAGMVLYDFAPIIHSWDMQLHTFSKYLLYFRLSWIFYNISILLIKVAMLIQLLRIFVPRGSQSRTYYVIHTLMWITTIYYTIMAFLHVFTCLPIHKLWHPWVEGKCMKLGVMSFTTASFNVFTDVCILLIAQRVIWKTMKRDGSGRIKLSLVFCAGIIPCAFSGMCLYYNHREMVYDDFVHDSAMMALACYGEIVGGMFVLFLPITPRFFSHVKKTVTEKYSSTNSPDLSNVTPHNSEPTWEQSRENEWQYISPQATLASSTRAEDNIIWKTSDEFFRAERRGSVSYLSSSSSRGSG